MTTNTPPNLQVVAPEVTAPAAPVAPAPEPQKDYVDPGPAEDRILSPEETENFFKTGSIKDPEVVADPPVTDPEQVAMVGEHFDHVQGEPATMAPAPSVPDPIVAQAAVQQDLQPPIPVTQGQPVPVQQAQVPPVPGVPVAPQAPVPTPSEAALQGQVTTLTNQVQQLMTAISQQQGTPAAAAPAPAAAAQPPAFNFQIPAQYAEAIASDDPNARVNAIQQLLNGVAASVHQKSMADVDARLQQIAPAIQRQVETSQGQQEIKRDMYQTYPELGSMQDMVVAAATQLQPQFPGGWSPDYRDAIAERLSPLVNGLNQKVYQNRASRGIVPQVVQQAPQLLPQGQAPGLPAGVQPVAVQGVGHMAPAAVQQGQPVLVRDAAGNYSQVYPQQNQQFAGPQARQAVQGQVDSGLQDIWSTLGF